jgi:hypothetical protein
VDDRGTRITTGKVERAGEGSRRWREKLGQDIHVSLRNTKIRRAIPVLVCIYRILPIGGKDLLTRRSLRLHGTEASRVKSAGKQQIQ